MPDIREITDLSAPELDVYARLSEGQLLHYYDADTALCAPNSGNRREKYAPTSFKRVMRKMTHVCGMTKRR